MKKLGTLLLLLIIATTSFAQKGKVTSALSYKEAGEIEKAWETIQYALDTVENSRAEKAIDWPRSYEVKGEILMEIYRKDISGLVDEPLFEALEAFKTALKYDDKDRYSKALVVDLTFLQTDLSNYAIKTYENEQYATAMKCFEKFMEISNISIMKESSEEVIDTAIIYNAGLAAFKAEDWENAIKYFKKSADNDYNGAPSYHFAFQAYQALGDTLKSINILQEGFEKYPESETLIVELINYYIGQGNANDAINYLDKAISQNPKNVSYYTAKGATLEKLGKQEDAIKVYKEAIEMDNSQFTPYYNLGVIFYNRGVNKLNEASQLPPSATKEYDEKIAEGKNHLKEALPFIESAYSIDSSEIAILESLRLIYYRLQMNDKYEEINKKIQSINK